MKLKSTLFLNIILCLLALMLGGCGSNVKKVDYDKIREVPKNASPTPILFRGAEFLIPPGQEIGYFGSAGYCGFPKRPVTRTALRRVIDNRYLEESFRGTLESVGYDVVGGLDLAYVQEDEYLRAEYTVSAKIKGTQIDVCDNDLNNFLIFFRTRSGLSGEMYLSVDWSVYDPVKRTVVYKTTTEGYTDRRSPTEEGLTVMVNEAFEMAAHNLGTDDKFYDLIVKGIKPTGWKSKRSDEEEQNYDSRRKFDSLERVSIEQKGLSRTPFIKGIERKRKHAVMIQKIGHGSGFFITKEGHILTNAHVVGNAIRMRVVTAGREEKLSAEVLRVDKARDVALLKLEKIPDDMQIVTLPIRTQLPSIGEEVYVLGTPQHYSKLQDTLTHGVVSAYRKNFKLHGIKANFIQSDVEVHGGNSGGPMYDQFGNVIGMSVIALQAGKNKIGHGLNLFVPISEALGALGISINGNILDIPETEDYGHSERFPDADLFPEHETDLLDDKDK